MGAIEDQKPRALLAGRNGNRHGSGNGGIRRADSGALFEHQPLEWEFQPVGTGKLGAAERIDRNAGAWRNRKVDRARHHECQIMRIDQNDRSLASIA